MVFRECDTEPANRIHVESVFGCDGRLTESGGCSPRTSITARHRNSSEGRCPMIGKHAPAVHGLSILLLAVGSVITYTEVTTGTHASSSAVRGTQTATPPPLPPALRL